MTATASTIDDLSLSIVEEILVRAPLDTTFTALIEEMGPGNETPDGTKLPMVLEAWPGGRWYRDLGEGNGHFWGHVQAIKRPALLEICGPLFISNPVMSNLQYRLKETSEGTLITFRHLTMGRLPDGMGDGMGTGWSALHRRVRARAEAQAGGGR